MRLHALLTVPAAEVRPAEDLAADEAALRSERDAVHKHGKDQVTHAKNAGEILARWRDRLKAQHGWVKWLKKIGLPRMTAENYIIIHQRWAECTTVVHLGVGGVLNFLRTGKTGEEDEDGDENQQGEASRQVAPEYVTLDQWDEMGKEARKEILAYQGDKKFNDQGDSEGIGWARWSWNPVTGCLHNCPYCYARDLAERWYEHKFRPVLHPGRLTAPFNTPFPEKEIAQEKAQNSPRALGLQNVFTVSMGDLFGRWVPQEWIEAVLKQVREAERWNFLFLTKFPVRLAEFEFPDNTWVGTTVDCQARVANAEKSFRKVKAKVKWLSCEPLIEPLKFNDLGAFQWIVLGGASPQSHTPEWRPPQAWYRPLVDEADRLGIQVYEKTNLWRASQGYPGFPDQVPDKAPKELRYLPEVE
jgi:protein gp37